MLPISQQHAQHIARKALLRERKNVVRSLYYYSQRLDKESRISVFNAFSEVFGLPPKTLESALARFDDLCRLRKQVREAEYAVEDGLLHLTPEQAAKVFEA